MRIASATSGFLVLISSLPLAACDNTDQNAEQTSTSPTQEQTSTSPTQNAEQTSAPPRNAPAAPMSAPVDSVPTTAIEPGAPSMEAMAPAAPQHQRPANSKFDKIDRNGDGIIEDAEFLASLKKRFTRLDADKNGVIEGGEVKSSSRLGRMDSNGDNKISEMEFLEGYRKLLKRLDQDGNGEVSAVEFSQFEKKRGSSDLE